MVGKDTLSAMNHHKQISPEPAESLVNLLSAMRDLDRDALGFLVGHMAAKNVTLALEAYTALMATELPPQDA
jgi:hypothetical protein